MIILGLKHEGHQILDNFIISDFCAIDVVKEDKVGELLSTSFNVSYCKFLGPGGENA